MKLSLKRIILRFIIGLILFMFACTGGLLGWVSIDTADSADAANKFLLALRERRVDDAYAMTTASFQAAQDHAGFTKVMSLVGLPLSYEMDPWRDRTLELSNRSRIRGWVLDLGGQDVRFTLDMVKEKGDWKVQGFTDPYRTGIGPGAWFRLIPLRQDLYVMTNKTIADFAEAVRTHDFGNFYANMSRTFTIGVSESRLLQAYKHFWEREDPIDLTGVEDLDPVYLELPSIETSSVGYGEESYEIGEVLVLEGYYPIKPKPLPFKFTYVYEHPVWKLFQFWVGVPTIEGLSPEICLQYLLRQDNKNMDRCFQGKEENVIGGGRFRGKGEYTAPSD